MFLKNEIETLKNKLLSNNTEFFKINSKEQQKRSHKSNLKSW